MKILRITAIASASVLALAAAACTPAENDADTAAETAAADGGDTPTFIVREVPADPVVVEREVPVPTPPDAEGRVPELWLIAPGQAPRSLGLLAIDQSHTVAVPQPLRQALASGATLAVTLEPPGGAPQGAPTGPIIAKGEIRRG